MEQAKVHIDEALDLLNSALRAPRLLKIADSVNAK